MTKSSEKGISQWFAECVVSGAESLARPDAEWPSQEASEVLATADLTEVQLEALVQVIVIASMHKPGNRRAKALETVLLSKIPADMRERVEFAVAERLVLQDEYLRWVLQMIGGFLNLRDGNCHCFNYAIRKMPEEGAVIEIGSFLGASVSVLSYYLTKFGRKNRLFNADPWHFEEAEKPIGGVFDASAAAFREYCVGTYKRNVAMFAACNGPATVQAFSDDFFSMWDSRASVTDVFGNPVQLGGPISFAYIDGAHTYEAAKKDFANVAKHLLPGGFVLFDDSNPQLTFGCVQAAQEAAQSHGMVRIFGSVAGINVFLRRG